MAAATPRDVRELSLTCEFDSYSNTQIQPFLDEAAMHADETAWGLRGQNVTRYKHAHALLAAHLMKLQILGSGTPARELASESLAGVASRTYHKPDTTGRDSSSLQLHATSYGQRYAALLDSLPLSPMVMWEGGVADVIE